MPEFFAAPLELPLWLAGLLQVGLGVVVPLVFGRSKPRLASAAAFATLALALPLLARAAGPPAMRVVFMGLGCLTFFRFLDLRRARTELPVGVRVWFAMTPFDVRTTSPATSRVPAGLVVAFVAYGAVAAVALAVLLHFPESGIRRWLVGAVFVYFAIDAVSAFLRLGYAAVGVNVVPFHITPVRSHSLAEFWGQRWNRPVHGWLKLHCFAPLARRRHPLVGIVAAFAASGLLHFLLVVVSASVIGALLAASFFLVHAALLGAERAMGVARWRPAAAWSWTFVTVLVTSPMLIDPTLRSLGI